MKNRINRNLYTRLIEPSTLIVIARENRYLHNLLPEIHRNLNREFKEELIYFVYISHSKMGTDWVYWIRELKYGPVKSSIWVKFG